MATHTPRGPYTSDELAKLYPQSLQLQQVQIILRHGERAPISARFQNAGLSPYWPYCQAAKRLTKAVMTSSDLSQWKSLNYERQIETLGGDDSPVIAKGPRGETDGICIPGEITDTGRSTTLALGSRLRKLYVDQLSFLPPTLNTTKHMYLRSTPMPRALESAQQALTGLYPFHTQSPALPPPVFITRMPADENLFDNTHNCARYGEMFRAFGERAAARWNESEDMAYLQKVLGKWMPAGSPRVAVDGKPRLSGIMDTINATRAHGRSTRLPREFYDAKALAIIDKVCVEEWFAGYKESAEFRRLGMGALVADMTTRMVQNVEQRRAAARSRDAVPLPDWQSAPSPDEQDTTFDDRDRAYEAVHGRYIRLALNGAHDTTIAGFLSSLGAFEDEPWPEYTSHVAVELFSLKDPGLASPSTRSKAFLPAAAAADDAAAPPPQPLFRFPSAPNLNWTKSWLPSLFSITGPAFSSTSKRPENFQTSTVPPTSISRTLTQDLSESDKTTLQNHYVRIRYNDRPVVVPGCRPQGRHLDGDETFCTLEAFKAVADAFAPVDWNGECKMRIGEPVWREGVVERPGFPVGDGLGDAR